MEECISLSPTCDDQSSINLSKERRKNKRRSTKLAGITDHDNTRSQTGERDSHEMDNRGSTSTKVPYEVPVRENWLTTEIDMFDPEVDWLDCSQAQTKQEARSNLLLTQGRGFVKLEELEFTLSQVESTDKSECCHPVAEIESGITNTELINICDVAENKFEPPCRFEKRKETDREVSIVEMILDDFCSLPFYQEGWFHEANDPTPYFRFRDKFILTYRRKRQNHSINDLEQDDEECISNCSSGLSVQEDYTVQLSSNQPSEFNPNTSDRLCKNLLNLSAFFTQNAKQDKPAEAAAISLVKPRSDLDLSLVTDSQMELENFTFFEDQSCTFQEGMHSIFSDYHWFSVEKEPKFDGCDDAEEPQPVNDQLPNSGSDSNKDKCELLDLSFCEKFFSHDDSFSKLMEDEGSNETMNILEHDAGPRYREKIATTSDKSQYFEEWNEDCDINFNTEELLNKSTTQQEDNSKKCHNVSSNEYMGFYTASQKPIIVSESAKQRARKILKELPEIEGVNNEFLKNTGDDWLTEDARAYQLKEKAVPCTSKQAKEQLNQTAGMLEDFLIDDIHFNDWFPENTQRDKNEIEVASQKQNISENQSTNQSELNASEQEDKTLPPKQPKFVQFLTASQKNITISNKAMQKAVHILSELPEIPIKDFKEPKPKLPPRTQETSVEECKEIKKQDSMKESKFNEDSQRTNDMETEFVGFLTASQKPISISNNAMKKALHILSELPEIPLKESPETEQKSISKNREILVKKNMDTKKHMLEMTTIDESAPKKFKICNVLKNRKHENPASSAMDSESAGFLSASEEMPQTLLTESADAAQKSVTKTKEALTHIEKNLEDLLSESPIPKLQKSTSFETKTPQTPLECGHLKATLSENLKPSSTGKTSSVIARNNLLSLSKRRKSKHAQSGPQTRTSSISEPTQKALAEDLEVTPKRNSNTFSDAVLVTSTPRLLMPVTETPTNISGDFKALKNSDVNHSRNFSESSTPNTQAYKNISASERIERLSMYGDPLPISPIPIPTRNTRRRLGLSRVRSSKK